VLSKAFGDAVKNSLLISNPAKVHAPNPRMMKW
jgi:hypothetical protein